MQPQSYDAAAAVLADRRLLRLEPARLLLAGRARMRTPMGAAERLTMRAKFGGADGHEQRLKLAAECCRLYRELFPREYAASQAPHFSIQREHEFYRLVNNKLFPLCVAYDDERRASEIGALIDHDPRFFLPAIPITGTQQHDWVNGCCGFANIQTVFKLALALIRHEGPRGWDALCVFLGVPHDPPPAPPLAAVGWTLFKYSCEVEESPLRFLPLAFELVTYKTGCVWLDVPPGLTHLSLLDWTGENIARLLIHRHRGEEINAQVLALDAWLDEDPPARIRRAVELWNNAAAVEAASPYAGMYVEDMET